MKKVKCTIEISLYEDIEAKAITLTQKEFSKQLSSYRSLVENSDGMVEEHNPLVYENECYTRTTYIFACGLTTVYLTYMRCKNGFCIK